MWENGPTIVQKVVVIIQMFKNSFELYPMFKYDKNVITLQECPSGCPPPQLMTPQHSHKPASMPIFYDFLWDIYQIDKLNSCFS